jgi:hypothetical protein
MDIVYRGMKTPWGTAQRAVILVEGMGRVATAAHGGIRLAPELNSLVPEHLRQEDGWYEEDEEFVIPYFFFEALLLERCEDADTLKTIASGHARRWIKSMELWPHPAPYWDYPASATDETESEYVEPIDR